MLPDGDNAFAKPNFLGAWRQEVSDAGELRSEFLHVLQATDPQTAFPHVKELNIAEQSGVELTLDNGVIYRLLFNRTGIGGRIIKEENGVEKLNKEIKE